MLHALLIGSGIYLGGAAVTAGLMAYGSARDGTRAGRYDIAFLGFFVAAWPVGLPVALSVMSEMRGAKGDGEDR